MATNHKNLEEAFPELDLYPLNTADADDDLFVTDLDEKEEPDEQDLATVEVESESSLYVFECVRCGGKHDMRNLKNNGESLICPRSGRVI